MTGRRTATPAVPQPRTTADSLLIDNTAQKAFDPGINFFDTVQAHGFGAPGKGLGETLPGQITHRHNTVILATKGGLRLD
jgi:aryl-alcohol dehydrogenase-like predicted oxidoreductase